MMINKKLRNQLRRKKYLVKWFLQYQFGKNQPYKSLMELKLDKTSKTLILAPHADDEWIGTSQILLHNLADVYYFQFLGNNYTVANKKMRREELESLQKDLGFHLYLSQTEDHYEDLANLINDNKYEQIFLPYPIDWHKEHIKVNDILLGLYQQNKLKHLPKLYFYHISVPFSVDAPLFYSSISKKDLALKIKKFNEIYPSQFNTPIARKAYQHRINAKTTQHYALEVYNNIDYADWTNLVTYVNKHYEKMLKPLIHHIDDLIYRQELSNAIFTDWKSQLKS